MAVAIRSIPTLQGEDAERFLKEADFAEKNDQKQDFGEKILLVRNFLREQGFQGRFIIVDAINEPGVIHYYQKNQFKFLYSSEINEARALGVNIKLLASKLLHTRLMYFDLIDIKQFSQKRF